ncbi:hypothetical protein Pcinc_025921 [Petrolisthes cinctipes]|uniref:Uncharacterized protein n=1 Tax=Petrolisthes cinctipes TaxID=88211 RepID=A0AAE1EQ25_PETCI|nr:hypothetical protein Pcinc_034535 [Petrolisthes cinctipes]KAK3868714.1 hypothetical protein Pcinc_025921 [Petrolisthes cinctipes]
MEVVDLQQPQHETAHSGSHTTEPGKGQVISHGTLSAQWHLPSAASCNSGYWWGDLLTQYTTKLTSSTSGLHMSFQQT